MKNYIGNLQLLFGKAYLHTHNLVKEGKASILEEIVLGRAFLVSSYPRDYLSYK